MTAVMRQNITNEDCELTSFKKFVTWAVFLIPLKYNKNVRRESMERFILKKLLNRKNSPYRKPLIPKGVRQVGKTWILKEFGKRYYENTAYFNFDENEENKQFIEVSA